uniref:Uncharacterized protein n=1 Tax=Rhizophora mucronata TaxID=61149 RepID=A0A2P2KJY4_RHIMU
MLHSLNLREASLSSLLGGKRRWQFLKLILINGPRRVHHQPKEEQPSRSRSLSGNQARSIALVRAFHVRRRFAPFLAGWGPRCRRRTP